MSETQQGGKHFKNVNDAAAGSGMPSPASERRQGHGSAERSQSGRVVGDPSGSPMPRYGWDDQASDEWNPPLEMPTADHSHDHDAAYYDGGRRRGHHRNRRGHVALVVVCVLVVVLAVVGFAGYRFYQSARSVAASAQTMVSKAGEFEDDLRSGDGDALQSTASEIASISASMKQEAQGPLWNAAENLPVVGEDVSRVRVLVSVADDLSANVLTPVAQSMAGVSMGTLFSDGQINVDMLTSLCDTVSQVQPAVARDAQRVDNLGEASLEQVNGPLQSARERLDGLNAMATGLSQVAPSLPAMLGANGTRNYLVIAQNNSEIRSLGGFPGSRMIMTVDNGKISLGDFQANHTHFADNSIPLTDDERHTVVDIMETGAAFAPGDTTVLPSFPRAAQVQEWCWQQTYGQSVDGVLSVDPVFLQSMLGLTGGVTTSDGTVVDGTNAAQILLNQVYYLDSDLQDPFFNEVAGLAMKQVMNNLGSVSMTDLASTVGQGITDRRVYLYMNDADEEAAIASLGADGEVSQDATKPITGFYVYDKTGSKLDWYLDMRSTVGDPVYNQDGSKSYDVTVTLHNTTTMDQMQNELPTYITGQAPESHGYSMITAYLIMAPAGGSITNLQVSADTVNKQEEATLYDHDVWAGYVNILPSNTATFTYTVTTSSSATDPLAMQMTPTGQSFQ